MISDDWAMRLFIFALGIIAGWLICSPSTTPNEREP